VKATLTDTPPAGPGWVYETKYDGIRCIATKRGGVVDLRSRNDLDLRGRFPGVAEALAADPADDFVVDGEVAVFDAEGVSRFGDLGRGGAPAYVVFDVLRADGEDVRGLPLLERKERLRALLAWGPVLRFSDHVTGDGAQLLARACAQGLEGLIAKRADSPYSEQRSRDWLKLKCSQEQELVIGGFTAPKGSREDFGALLVGHFEDGELRYAGKVGTGFDRATLRDLAARLAPLVRDSSPFADAPRFHAVTWVEPELVAQVAFTEWTRDGRLRHPRYVGLRTDKPARDVVRERG
jgi:bifunctional non-homologous end joining protein LigD